MHRCAITGSCHRAVRTALRHPPDHYRSPLTPYRLPSIESASRVTSNLCFAEGVAQIPQLLGCWLTDDRSALHVSLLV